MQSDCRRETGHHAWRTSACFVSFKRTAKTAEIEQQSHFHLKGGCGGRLSGPTSSACIPLAVPSSLPPPESESPPELPPPPPGVGCGGLPTACTMPAGLRLQQGT